MTQHPYQPDASFDGGDLDCGNGLLLLIRKNIDPLPVGSLLEIRSREISVREDLPAWCRLTGNDLVSTLWVETEHRFLVCKGSFDSDLRTKTLAQSSLSTDQPSSDSFSSTQTVDSSEYAESKDKRSKIRRSMPVTQPIQPVQILRQLPAPTPGRPIPPLSVMGIGSWPRPRWMLSAIHDHLEGRLSETEYQAYCDDAVRLVWQHQQAAGVQVLTDGEQRRDSYASFVGGRLDNCQLIPLVDLLPYVDDPEKFEREMRALDIPAQEVRHPAVFGPLGRSRPLAVHEYQFLASLTDQPIKIALPGPYLLTRTMWMECISDRAYQDRDELAVDVVRVLREELHELLHAGASIVQFDEPVLSEVVFAAPPNRSSTGRSFMCGALSDRLPPAEELLFAQNLFQQLVDGLPLERIGLHICRGNWSRDESVALAGGYTPLMDFLQSVSVGNLFLELCTPRAGEMEVLSELPQSIRIGVGVVNQKLDRVEPIDQIRPKIERAIELFGIDRVMLTPDCGFATFADNPIASTEVAIAKLKNISLVREQLLGS